MARPIDYVLRVYPTEALAVAEEQSALAALQVLGNEVTATGAIADHEGHPHNITEYTVTAGQDINFNQLFDVGEYVTITGFDNANNNNSDAVLLEVGTSTIKVTATSGTDETKASGTFTFLQASSARPHVDNNNQAGSFADTSGLTQQYNFFTHERMYYRFDIPISAKEFYIDWDDGDDNTPEKANFSVRKYDLPQNFAIFEHTYTKHGAFYPLLRVTSPFGFKSKYYTACDSPRSSYRELEGVHDLTATQQTGAPEQNISIVSMDSNRYPRIPEFFPSNSPPVGVLKVDRASVYAGIDNTVFSEALTATNTALGAAARGYVYIDGVDLGIRHASGIDGGVYTIQELVDVIYINTNNEIIKETFPGTTGIGAALQADCIFPSDGTGLKRIISVKLRNVKELSYGDAGLASKFNVSIEGLYPDERVWIRLVDNADIASGHQSFSLIEPTDARTIGKSYPCFCNVSNGNPYISINDPRYRIMPDGSDSIARNSNVTIAKYWLYDDKLRVRDKAGTTGSGGAKESILDSTGAAGAFLDKHTDVFGEQIESSTDPKQSITYTLDYYRGNQIDFKEFYATKAGGGQLEQVGRFYDEFRLLRLQVEDSSEDGPNATMVENVTGQGYRAADRMDRSFIEHDSNYKKPNGGNLAQRPGSLKSNGLLLYRNDSGVWIDLAARNPSTKLLNFGGDGSNLGSMSRNIIDTNTSVDVNPPKNFLLVAKDRKYSKIFFRMDNDANLRMENGSSAVPYVKLQAWYTGPTGWKELAIKDETMLDYLGSIGSTGNNYTALHRSGPVSWDIPEDWTPVTTGSTGYGSSWDVPTVNYTHASATTITVAAGCRITAAAKTFENVTNADTIYKAGDKIAITGTDGATNDGTYTIAICSGNTITTDEAPAGDDTDTAIVVNFYVTVASGASSFGNEVPIPSTPSQLWESTNWPQTAPTGGAGGYGILFGIKSANSSGLAKLQCYQVTVCDNPHSRIVRVVDPKHISLNEAMIAQSVGFSRKGTYHAITDRLGKTEIRKLGASGGKLSFGGVDLGKNTASEGNRTRERFVEYQKQGTPVYYDVRHKNGKYTRLYGVIDSLSEDIPVGEAIPKFGISMIVSHIIEYSKDGVWVDEVISVGGLVDTDTRFYK